MTTSEGDVSVGREEVLRVALAPVVADLAAYGLRLKLVHPAGDDSDQRQYFKVNSHRLSVAFTTDFPGLLAAYPDDVAWQTVRLADEIQSILTEDIRVHGKALSWPRAADGDQPLDAQLVEGKAMWISPYPTSSERHRIGSLAPATRIDIP